MRKNDNAADQFRAAMAAQDARISLLWDDGKICVESRQDNICIRQVLLVDEARRLAQTILAACDKAEGK